jgi:hypothetical protein
MKVRLNRALQWLHVNATRRDLLLLDRLCVTFLLAETISGTSRGGTYHNSRFKAEAEKRGLSIEYDKKIGWSIIQPTPALRSLCARQHWNGKLTVHRSWQPKDPKEKVPSSTRKYVCPVCGMSVRATKEVNLICGDCRETMEIA